MHLLLETITDRQTQRLEEAATHAVSAVLHRQRRRLEDMGIEEAAKRPESEWGTDKDEMAAALYLLLRRPWDDSFELFTASRGIVTRPQDRDRLYGDWAGGYSERIGGGIVNTNRDVVIRLAAKVAAGETLPANPLRVLSTTDRAIGIGITETTSGITAGETSGAEMYRRETGRLLLPYWLTENDERVCKICGPLDNQPSTFWRHRFAWGPPAHPRCRCRLEWRDV